MPRKTSSQWDFGDLFNPAEPTPPSRHVYSVSELTGSVRRALEKEFGTLWVNGEVSNLRTQASGHAYFTLKDRASQLSCVLFRGEARENRHYLQDGQMVVLQGNLTVYEPRGQYQLRVTAIELQGVGALQLAFEKLKQKLQAEGLFAQERKRPIPKYPRRIGLITSPTGAAIRDVLHVIQRRQPALEIILVPCRVQGDEAAPEMVQAMRLLNSWAGAGNHLDLILLTRGGGSLEDLWAFNEEILARAIFESGVPVVSAVGHEIDFTISDFVADLRAATPSAAAEIITEGPFASRQFVAEAWQRIRQRVRQSLARHQDDLDELMRRLARVHPKRVLQEKLQYLDDLQTSLSRSARSILRSHRQSWNDLHQRFVRIKPSQVLRQRRQLISDLEKLMAERARHVLAGWNSQCANLAGRLRLLGPDNVLTRGYSITKDARTGQVIRDAAQVSAGQRILTRFKAGEIGSIVEEQGGAE